MNPLPAEVAKVLEDIGRLTNNNSLVESLRSALSSSEHGAKMVPALAEEVLEEAAWRERITPNGKAIRYGPDQFRRFITAPFPDGLEQDFDRMKAEFCKTPRLLDLWDAATVGERGDSAKKATRDESGQFIRNHSNRMVPGSHPDQGTTAQYAIRKLRADAPELHARVIAGELSPHRAMILAGFRRAMVQLPIDDPEAAGRVIARHFQGEALQALIQALAAHQVPKR